MNSIRLKQNQLLQRFQILTETRLLVKKNFSKDSEDDSPPKEGEDTNATTVRKGILHDKQQSVKEESYFHKEGQEQLKMLKKKLKKMKGKSSEQPEKDDKN